MTSEDLHHAQLLLEAILHDEPDMPRIYDTPTTKHWYCNTTKLVDDQNLNPLPALHPLPLIEVNSFWVCKIAWTRNPTHGLQRTTVAL